MENRIKEQQLGLFADRTSSHYWWANQFRLLLASLAYVLMEGIRRLALKGTKLARAQVTTIRLKLLKIGRGDPSVPLPGQPASCSPAPPASTAVVSRWLPDSGPHDFLRSAAPAR